MDLSGPRRLCPGQQSGTQSPQREQTAPVSEWCPVSVQQSVVSHELDQGIIWDIDTCIKHRKLHPPTYHLGTEDGATACGGGCLCE